MIATLGDVLPLALGLALSPFAIVTTIILLLGPGGRGKAASFGVGWLLSLALLTGVAFWVTDAVAVDNPDTAATGVDGVQLAFGLLFFALAGAAWRKRPRPGAPATSTLLDRLDGLSVAGALGIGLAQGLLVIKNLPLAIGAGARFGEAGLAGASAAAAVVSFALIGSSGVLVPLVITVFTGDRLAPALAEFREWIETHLTAITITMLVVLGGFFFGQGLGLLG